MKSGSCLFVILLFAAEAVAQFCKAVEIEAVGHTAAFLEVDREDRAALGFRRQIDEEDLVESSFAEQFRR